MIDINICIYYVQLLEKQDYERLGWGEDGIEEIKAHPYFKSLDWNMVKQRQLIPPYIPNVKTETDLSNFDEMFTSMPVCISHSSAIEIQNTPGEMDPFQDFEFNPTATSIVLQQQPVILQSAGSSSTNNPIIRARKRHSAALSIPTTNECRSLEDSRVIKKRQTTTTSSQCIAADIFRSPTITSLGRQEDSRSSLSFSFTRPQHAAIRAGSEVTIGQQDDILFQSPLCSVPSQIQIPQQPMTPSTLYIPHSNTSTINNSLCSHLTLDSNDHVMQQSYFPLPPGSIYPR